jgi:nickel superoxide dismutase
MILLGYALFKLTNKRKKIMLNKIKTNLKNQYPAPVVHAHCDGPCGIYDPASARIAAEAVLSMTKKLLALKPPTGSDPQAWADYLNTFSRYTAVKEEQAHLAKKELLVLWTDYFKPPHLEANPALHDIFWKAAKQCSECKVHVNVDACEKLLKMIEEIHGIFWATKNRKVEWYTAG